MMRGLRFIALAVMVMILCLYAAELWRRTGPIRKFRCLAEEMITLANRTGDSLPSNLPQNVTEDTTSQFEGDLSIGTQYLEAAKTEYEIGNYWWSLKLARVAYFYYLLSWEDIRNPFYRPSQNDVNKVSSELADLATLASRAEVETTRLKREFAILAQIELAKAARNIQEGKELSDVAGILLAKSRIELSRILLSAADTRRKKVGLANQTPSAVLLSLNHTHVGLLTPVPYQLLYEYCMEIGWYHAAYQFLDEIKYIALRRVFNETAVSLTGDPGPRLKEDLKDLWHQVRKRASPLLLSRYWTAAEMISTLEDPAAEKTVRYVTCLLELQKAYEGLSSLD